MSYAFSKIDANQPGIVSALIAVGCSVQSLAMIGVGCPDLLIFSPYTKSYILVEVKDGEKPPSARKLTRDQTKFWEAWKGPIALVESIEQALIAVGVPKTEGP